MSTIQQVFASYGPLRLPPAVVDINSASIAYADGDFVRDFTDDAGTVWTFGSSGEGPLFKYSNGLPIFRLFGASQSWRSVATLDLSAYSKVDIFIRFKSNANVAGSDILFEHGTNLSSDNPAIFAFTDSSFHVNAGWATTGPVLNYWTTSEAFNSGMKLLHLKIDTALPGATETAVKVDNAATGGSHTGSPDLSGNFGNKTLYIGMRGGSTLGSNIDLSRIRICVGGLTASQETAIATAMMNPAVRSSLLVCVGDSQFTTQYTTYPVPHFIAQGLGSGWTVYNEAIGGQRVDQIISNFATQITPHMGGSESTKIVVIRAMVNDVIAGHSDATIYNDLKTLAGMIQGAGGKAAVCTQTNIGASNPNNPGAQTHCNAINNLLRADHSAFDYFIDIPVIQPLLNNGANGTYFDADQLHEILAGATLEGAAIRTALP